MFRVCTMILVLGLLPSLTLSQSAGGDMPLSGTGVKINRVVTLPPLVELHVAADCNGWPIMDDRAQDYAVFEDGIPVSSFSVQCPDSTVTANVSVALVFDASGSMSGQGNSGAKAAGHAFISTLDGNADEAALLWFNSTTTLAQAMTSDTTQLHLRMDNLPASGATAAWDAAYAGVLEVISSGNNANRAVLLLTDGADGSSIRTPLEVIMLAQQEGVRVFTVGLGAGINEQILQQIAASTGAWYDHVADPAALASRYVNIAREIARGTHECVISYDRSCWDGEEHLVHVQLTGTCGLVDTAHATHTYTAPYDPSTFHPVQLALSDVQCVGGDEVRVPLQLNTALNNETFQPFFLEIAYDTTRLTLIGTETSPGDLLEHVPLAVAPRPGGSLLHTGQAIAVSGSGKLLDLRFKARNVRDTTTLPLSVVDVSFDRGCLNPAVTNGSVTVLPLGPYMQCDITAPDSVSWDDVTLSYTPDPFTLRARVENSGTAAAGGCSFRIIYDSSAVALVNPLTEVQAGTPADVPPAASSEASWQLRALGQRVSTQSVIRVIATFDNHPATECHVLLSIPGNPDPLSCSLDVPTIAVDTVTGRYDPMPFVVTTTVRNDGYVPVSNVSATIYMDGLLMLTAPDSPSTHVKVLSPDTLQPGQSGTASWTLAHQPSPVQRDNMIHISADASLGRRTGCEKSVTIPGTDTTKVPRILASGPLEICLGHSVTLDAGSGYTFYEWNTGSQERMITVYAAGQYYARVRNNQSAEFYTDTVTVTVLPKPQPTITVTGPNPFCEGDTLRLELDPWTTYTWNTGDTTRVLYVTTSGRFSANVTDSNGCKGSTHTVFTHLIPLPGKPLISRQGNLLLSSDTATTWQWYRNGVAIPGADSSSLALSATGTYAVVAANTQGCTTRSDDFVVTSLTGIPVLPTVSGFDVDVFPEPNEGSVTVSVCQPGEHRLGIAVYDLLGRETHVSLHAQFNGTCAHTLDLDALPAGSYVLRLQVDDEVRSRRILKR